MRIDRIELCNFGSYVGVCVFDLKSNSKGNIVLIGGKNGAGKTTLFSGIKLCLYGNKAAGFENINAFYRKEVRKYINDVSKFDAFAHCYVKLTVAFSNGQNEDIYELMRLWHNNSDVLDEFEEFFVRKNNETLSDEEIADFENYIMNIIPPEMFDLFFFDGEQIADYFLGEDGNERVKNAFMVLCGYDTFDIMQKNFKRLTYGKRTQESDTEINYVEAKQIVRLKKMEYEDAQTNVEFIKATLESVNLEIKDYDKKYKLSGGVTFTELNEKLAQIKEEERYREEKNAQLKKMANDSIPFIIVRDLLIKVAEQLNREHDKQQFELLQDSLLNILPIVMEKVYQRLEWNNDSNLTKMVIQEFSKEMSNKKIEEVTSIICVAGEEYSNIQTAIAKYLLFNKEDVIRTEQEIKESLERAQCLRSQIENYNIDGIQEYLDKKNILMERIHELNNELQKAMDEVQVIKQEYEDALGRLKREERKFEEEMKNESIISLSERSVAFLDELQRRLYKNEIQKVEQFFMKKIKELARKNRFIDKILIDKEFNVHIFKRVSFNAKSVCSRIKELGISAYSIEYGQVHCNGLLLSTETQNLNEFIEKYNECNEQITVLQEIEKSRLSKGEKQVFIMALYWAFMQLNKQNIPFVIDTPFARIDSEHRANITNNFFMDLSGQVFIFSTNEEIVGEHYEQMSEKIQAKFLLENIDNIKTNVYANEYFGG